MTKNEPPTWRNNTIARNGPPATTSATTVNPAFGFLAPPHQPPRQTRRTHTQTHTEGGERPGKPSEKRRTHTHTRADSDAHAEQSGLVRGRARGSQRVMPVARLVGKRQGEQKKKKRRRVLEEKGSVSGWVSRAREGGESGTRVCASGGEGREGWRGAGVLGNRNREAMVGGEGGKAVSG